jgi:hypothetical protein
MKTHLKLLPGVETWTPRGCKQGFTNHEAKTRPKGTKTVAKDRTYVDRALNKLMPRDFEEDDGQHGGFYQ